MDMSVFTDEDIEILSTKLYHSIEIRDRKYHLKKYPKCFVGTDAVLVLQALHPLIQTDKDAEEIGQKMLEMEIFNHVTGERPFKNKHYFYRFKKDEREVIEKKNSLKASIIKSVGRSSNSSSDEVNSKVPLLDLPAVEVVDLSEALYGNLTIKDRTYHLKKYPKCFLGTEAVEALQQLHPSISSVEEAEEVGQNMMDLDIFYHVEREKDFKNKEYFYRFVRDDDLGRNSLSEGGARRSWLGVQNLIPKIGENAEEAKNTNYEPTAWARDDGRVNINSWKVSEEVEVSPLDEHNIKLLDNVHPRDWMNPEEKDSYTLIVIGAGSGGLVTAAGAAGVGAKVCIIEEHLMGGDCLNFGCVPSKALIRASRAVKDIQNATNEFGIEFSEPPKVNFGKIMERLRKIRAEISYNDSCKRFSKDLGVAVYLGRAKFIGPNRVKIGKKKLSFQKAVIATGASPAVPPIEGLRDVPFLTDLTVFNLTELPPKMMIIGAGPIGLELAQAFARFGSKVTVFVKGDKLLPKEDRDAAKVIEKSLLEDGVKLLFDSIITEVALSTEGNLYAAPWHGFSIYVTQNGKDKCFFCDAILVATGRAPNVEDIGLEKAGVEFDKKRGVHINKYMQTTNTNVYAVGDVCSQFQYTHVADFMARTVIRNALFFGTGKHTSLLIPWATYTEPEVAHVGLYEHDMEKRKISFDTYQKNFADVDRAICDGELQGFVKIHCKKGTDEILGATIVNTNAGNMISEVTLAMQMKVGLASLGQVIHPYPTQAEAIRMCGDLYNKSRLTGTTKGLLSRIANRSLS